MSSLKSRVDKLHAGSISTVSSYIVIYKNDKLIRKVIHGSNPNKVIEIALRF